MNPTLKEWKNQPPLGRTIGNSIIISNHSPRTAWWRRQVKTTNTRPVTQGCAPELESWQWVPIALELKPQSSGSIPMAFLTSSPALTPFLPLPPAPLLTHAPAHLPSAVLPATLSSQGLGLGWNILPQCLHDPLPSPPCPGSNITSSMRLPNHLF